MIVSKTEAYKKVFGRTTFYLESVVTITSKDGNGNDIQVPVFGKNPGYGSITLDFDVVLNGGSMRDGYPVPGPELVAHELAHNLTWDGFEYDNDTFTFGNGAYDYPAGLGVRAGNYTGRNCGVSDPDGNCEVTADAIASWGLGDFDGVVNKRTVPNLAQARRNHVNEFMKRVLKRKFGCPIYGCQ